MTGMPNSVKVGPHVYTIVRKSGADINFNGMCDFDTLQIWVKKRLRKSKAQEILLHEVLHACTHPSLNGNKKYQDEDFVDGVAPTLLQVMQENPDLLTYLTT
jgi:hypothetical protein